MCCIYTVGCFCGLLQQWVYQRLCKFFKNEVHWVRVTFGVYTESGYTWVIVLAAFFLMGGYFIIQVVFFRPWGLQNTKNAFYKKMLCDQASNKTFFIYQTGRARSTQSFYNIKARLSIPRAKIN